MDLSAWVLLWLNPKMQGNELPVYDSEATQLALEPVLRRWDNILELKSERQYERQR